MLDHARDSIHLLYLEQLILITDIEINMADHNFKLDDDTEDTDEEELEDQIIFKIFRAAVDSKKGPKKKRQRFDPASFWDSTWGLLISDPSVNDPTSVLGKRFRRRFRVPFPVFNDILLPLAKKHRFFHKTRQSRIPLAAKVLAALRVLGRDSCADSIAELLQNVIGESTVYTIFQQFVTGMATKVLPHVVKCAVEDVNDIEYRNRVAEAYSRLGLPGCLGSLDGTRISWGMCPKSERHNSIGKESHPTLVFMALVDHFRRVQYISGYYLGSNNDLTLCHNDSFLLRVQHGLLDNYEFQLYDERGRGVPCRGGYYISDGGMLNHIRFIDPDHLRMTREAILWSEWVESVRKDVECKLVACILCSIHFLLIVTFFFPSLHCRMYTLFYFLLIGTFNE
jgi:hypothetical protein